MSPGTHYAALAPHAPDCTGHHCVDCGGCLPWDPTRTPSGKRRIDIRAIRVDSKCTACRDERIAA